MYVPSTEFITIIHLLEIHTLLLNDMQYTLYFSMVLMYLHLHILMQ